MKKFLALLLALTMALALVACGGGDDAASDTTADSGDDAAASTGEFEEMTWKFACSATETSPWVDGAKEFARIVGEKTGGRKVILLFFHCEIFLLTPKFLYS